MLLLNAGRVVPASTLVDALWGERLPANAVNALQGRISRLRRAVAEAGQSPSARARALQAHAVVARPRSCIVHPSAECAPPARESWEIFTALGERRRAAMSRTLMAVEGIGGPDTATPLDMLAEANAEFVRAGDEWGQALVLFVEMELHGFAGRLDEATETTHRALVGMANTIQYLLANMGHIALLLGDPDRAERLFAEAAMSARELGADGSPLAEVGEGLLARHRGDLVGAGRHGRSPRCSAAGCRRGPVTR